MSNKKATKRALLTSITALAMCVVMLAGTTFAWFTDTATASVNKIQAGTLDVALEMATEWNTDGSVKTWKTAEGQTLEFRKANGATEAEKANVLWEPGCTYELPGLRVVNNGDLAIKYEIKITGINGDAELNNVIDWTLNDVKLGEKIGTLDANGKSEALVIKGHMKEQAGNDYQGKSIDGIAITVYATQNTVEYDSSSKDYDADAFDALKSLYPVSASAVVTDKGAKIEADTVKVDVPKGAIADGVDNVSVTVTKSADVSSKFEISETESDVTVQQFNIDVTGLVANNDNEITVKMFIGKGYTFTGNKVTVQHLNGETVEKIEGTYDSTTGFVTFNTKSFSPFAVATPNVDAVIGTGTSTTYYAGLTEAVAAGGEITLLRDVSLTKTIVLNDSKQNVTINGGNYKVECPGDGVFEITKGTLTINSGSYHDTETTKRIWGAVYAYGTAVVNINGGTFNGGKQTPGQDSPVCVFAGNNAVVNITGGSFTNDDCSTVIYAGGNGKINISGGFFNAKEFNDEYGRYYVLNIINKSNANIAVTGGTFVNYDPSTGDDSGIPATFVSEGCHVTSEKQSNGNTWYTVVPNSN